MVTGGLIVIAIIIWTLSINEAIYTSEKCRHRDKTIKCPTDTDFLIQRYFSIIYVFMMPIIVLLTFATSETIPLIFVFAIWFVKNIYMHFDRIVQLLKRILLIEDDDE